MKRFGRKQIREAVDFALQGGQALHVWDGTGWSRPGTPACFRRSHLWAHLFDQDAARLEATARRLGVRVIVIQCRGLPRQHVDLCGKPLARAIHETIQEQPDDTKGM